MKTIVLSSHQHYSVVMNRKSSRICMMAGFGKKNDSVKVSKAEIKPKNVASSTINDAKLVRHGKGDIVSEMHCPTFNMQYPGLKAIHSDPPIFEVDNFFTEDVCGDLIRRASIDGFMVPSQTFSATAGSKRTSTTWYLRYDQMPELLEKANLLTGWNCVHLLQPVRINSESNFWPFQAFLSSIMRSRRLFAMKSDNRWRSCFNFKCFDILWNHNSIFRVYDSMIVCGSFQRPSFPDVVCFCSLVGTSTQSLRVWWPAVAIVWLHWSFISTLSMAEGPLAFRFYYTYFRT